MRHEPATARKKVTTQRNLKIKPGDLEETFGSVARESTIVQTPRRDRTPKGVSDGRGKRSVAEVLMSMPNDAARATYAMERIASLEDQIAKILDLCTPEARAIIFATRKSLQQYWDE
jgi:hypothetical protein